MKKAEKQFDLKRRLCLISALSFTILYILSALVLEPIYFGVSSDVSSSDALCGILYYSCLVAERVAVYICYAAVIVGAYKLGAKSCRSITLIFAVASVGKYLVKTCVNWAYLGAVPSYWYLDLLDAVWFASLEIIELLLVKTISSRVVQKKVRLGGVAKFERIYDREDPLLSASLVASVVVILSDLAVVVLGDAVTMIMYGAPEQSVTVWLMLASYLSTVITGVLCYIAVALTLYILNSRLKNA